MSAFLKKHAIRLTYLKGGAQRLRVSFGVQKVSSIFLLTKIDNYYRLSYKGGIDYSPQAAYDSNKEYLTEIKVNQRMFIKVTE